MGLFECAVLLLCHMAYSYGGETNHLGYYETLSHVRVSSQVKRSSQSHAVLVKRVQFHAFQRDFHLTLKSGSPVLTKDFRARLIHKDGSSTTFPIDQSKIFTGHDTHNENSAVHAHLEESLWSIQIMEENEIYAVEPAWRILRPSENPHNDTMVAYRMSDLKGFNDGYRFCKSAGKQKNHQYQLGVEHSYSNGSQSHVLSFAPYDFVGSKRERRSSHKDTCTVYLVGDADLFNKRCRRNHISCSSLMIQYLESADKIFRVSAFEDRYGIKHLGIGVQVKELALLSDYSHPSLLSNIRHFNEKYDKWNSDSKLISFATYMRMSQKKYCINHLLTEFPDEDSVLGLAYVNNLCYYTSRGSEAENSGITSGTNKIGFLLPTLMISLVLTHGISYHYTARSLYIFKRSLAICRGHNFGAYHDPDTPECAPSDYQGGKYLMWSYAVSGLSPNNKRFSVCSLRHIGDRVPAPCFQERSRISSFCGNGLVDEGEECDAGFFGINDDNKCCSKHCMFKPGAVCSEINSECCIDCQIASDTTVCNDTLRPFSCSKRSFCSGVSNKCIDGGFLPDGSECGEMHKCYGGSCANPCEQETMKLRDTILKPCLCTKNANEACMWCCFNATNPWNPGHCRPVMKTPRINGTFCYKGICEGGVCKPDIHERSKTRIGAYIKFIKTSSLGHFLRANIVIVVIFLSLIIWLPAVAWVHGKDMEERHLRELLLKALIKQIAEEERLRREKSDDTETFEESGITPGTDESVGNNKKKSPKFRNLVLTKRGSGFSKRLIKSQASSNVSFGKESAV